MCIRHDHNLPGVKRQGRRSRSTVTRSVRPQSGADIFPVVCTFTSCSAGQNSGHSSLELPLVLTVIATCVAIVINSEQSASPISLHQTCLAPDKCRRSISCRSKVRGRPHSFPTPAPLTVYGEIRDKYVRSSDILGTRADSDALISSRLDKNTQEIIQIASFSLFACLFFRRKRRLWKSLSNH